MNQSQKFSDLGRPRRIWAVAAIHGEVDRLVGLHDTIGSRFQAGDRLVYLGNYLGRGRRVMEVVDELLAFRRALLAVPGMLAGDIVYLRGCQEEMWQKLLQLQFAPNPAEVLMWMLRQGLDTTLAAYGGNADHGMTAAREGAVSVTRWTNSLRAAIRSAPGHENLLSALRRAACTRQPPASAADGTGAEPGTEPGTGSGTDSGGVLLVSAGIDTSRPFGSQSDSFWWGGANFNHIGQPYEGFRRIVRGYDPNHAGMQCSEFTASLDGGCGFGGPLVAACLTPDGEVIEVAEV